MTKLLILLTLWAPVVSAQKLREADYVERWCKGIVEHRLPDRRRVDCLTETHAYEVDWAHKWYEGLGQALSYSVATGLAPGVALIVGPRDERHVRRLREALKYYELDVDVQIISK